jgi:hypothetical protein
MLLLLLHCFGCRYKLLRLLLLLLLPTPLENLA